MINCPWCSNPFEPTGSGRCPHCGTLPPTGEKPQVVKDAPAAEERPGGEESGPRSIFDLLLGPEGGGLPWERRREHGILRSLWMTVWATLLSPFRTFRAMRRSGGWWEPLSFALLVATPCFALGALMQALSRQATPAGAADIWALLLPGGEPARTLIELGLTPLLALLLPVGAGLGAHLCLRLFRQPGSELEATIRVSCYAVGSASLLAVVPVCGKMLLLVWYLIIGTIGLVMVHRARMLPALGALALPPAVFLVLLGIAMSILGLARMGGAQ